MEACKAGNGACSVLIQFVGGGAKGGLEEIVEELGS